MAGFELLEDFFGSGDDVFGEASESGDLDAVAFFVESGRILWRKMVGVIFSGNSNWWS